ncbi:retrovirus-related Pol polyprotein from transposon 297 [Trichonephila clavipes]|nr:retrovirus-related Pol polyprotein from transposon 297 [Trichonephila clavipes]
MDLFLTLFERQTKLLDLGEDLWVPYLIGTLPSDVTSLIAREPEEKCRDYSHIRGMLLQRFKLTAEKFWELFSLHRKSPNGTWKDYYFEIRAYFEGWLNELKIDSFNGLKNLMIADQMKKRCTPECKEHYLDIWEELISAEMLADKLEAFDNIRRSLPSGPRRHVKASETVNDGRQVSFRKPERPPKREYSHLVPNERSPLRCYGCGKQGVIKSRCPTCNPNALQRTDVATNHINAYTAQTRSPRLTLIDITFCGIKERVCADTGSSHSIAGERMFEIFKDKGLLFQETTLAMSLADGQQTTGEALTTQVMVEIEGRSVLTKFIILPKAKGNRTLLGTDFLSSAGLVLDVKNTCWYFWDNFTHKYPFGEELDTPSILEKMSSNTCQLRKIPPYIPVKKEILRKKIEDLLEKDIIEECESPYGAPVVLIPKLNNQFRQCIDQLNEVTVPDTYPLPRMDDLLQEAKHTAYISTIDLKSGYHQVNVNPADRDKTAFVCPFGTYRFKRMPFGLKNAPATFQRLMDIFRRGLPVLAYLDDIIIMSPTFEQHLTDLEAVFKRLMDFKLRANREKCQFSCSHVKYLGLWITPQGIEVDHEKTPAILGIPPPKNVKQLQSFLQTCSLYQKFIANFSEIARPLSNLTKKGSLEMVRGRGESISNLEAMFGAVLLQGEDKEEHPVEFASRLLNPAERNYSTTEREALAVVWALNKFRGYIDGASITVASDHQPLRWLMKLKSPTGRLARWALQLQSFNLNMEYIPGKSNVVANMLSQPACHEENELCEVCTVAIDVPSRYMMNK